MSITLWETINFKIKHLNLKIADILSDQKSVKTNIMWK